MLSIPIRTTSPSSGRDLLASIDAYRKCSNLDGQCWAKLLLRKHLAGFGSITILEANTKTPSIPRHPSTTAANQ